MSMFYISHIPDTGAGTLILGNDVCLSEFNFSRIACLYFI